MDMPKLSAAAAKAAAMKALETTPFVAVATFGPDGWPDLRTLAVAAKDGIDTLWFATGTDGKKVAELKANPKSAIYGYDPQSMKEFRLFGSIELLSDSASRRKAWRDDFAQYFPDGVDSPNMVVMKFTMHHGEYTSYDAGVGTF
jgi:Uncharacterized stress protein (general stress protein 26)